MRSTSTLLLVLGALFFRSAAGQEAPSALEFIENKGQWDERARYAAQVGSGARLFAEKADLTYALIAGLPGHGAEAPGQPNGQLAAHALRLEFDQPNPASLLEATGETPGRRHYLRGALPAHWAADVRAWQQLRYRQLWVGIDLVLKQNAGQQLEYDLLLAPGANPDRARWHYRGADALRLDPATGNLLVKTSVGLLTEHRPQAWQTDPATGRHQPVPCAFELRGTALSFRLGAYDRSRPLVIDPAVQFASYTGSAVENWGFSATHDAQGNLYTAGVVFEAGYPITTGAYQISFGGSTDIAIMKFNTAVTGTAARAWATYLGGSNLEFPHSLLVNPRGELLMLGTTSSPNFPVTATALGRTFRGGPAVAPFSANSPFVLPGGADLVVTRLSASGGQLRASTYLGGTGTDGLLDATAALPRLRHNYGDAFRGDLALDPQGNVYVASLTGSADFPGVAPGAYRGGSTDGLVTSLDSSLSRVRWTTLLGGDGADAAYSVQREDAGGLLVAGGTTSATLAGAAGGYQATPGGDVDGYVARLTAAGALTQATYLGTGSYDQAFFVRTGPGGQVYVLGQTLGPYPATAGAFALPRGTQFIQQLNPALTGAGFASVFGSGRNTTDFSPTAFGVDCYGRMALAGWGGGLDPSNGSTLGLPTTPNALQTRTDGVDFYLMQLSDGARALDYATFFGTTADDHVDGGTSRFDSQNVLYQAVCACDQGAGGGIPIPPGAFTYAAVNGAPKCNNAAFKFAFLANTSPAGADTVSVCARSGSIRLGGSPAGGTWAGPGVSGTVATGFVFSPSNAILGPQVLTYTSPAAANGCAGTSTRRITVLPQAVATLTAPRQLVCLRPGDPAPARIPLTGLPAGGTFSGVGMVPGTNLYDATLAGPGNHSITYEVGAGRCPASATLVMSVIGVPPSVPHPPRRVCANDPPLNLPDAPPGGVWRGPGVTGGIGRFVFTPSPALIGGPHLLLYTVLASPACEPPVDTLRIVVLPAGPRATVPLPDTLRLCAAGRPLRLPNGQPAGGTWTGPGVSGTLAAGFVFTPAGTLLGGNALTYTGPLGTTPECPGRKNVTVLLSSALAQVAAPDTVVCTAGGPQPLSAVPPGGTWAGPGVTGTAATGFFFTPNPALAGTQVLRYVGPAPADTSRCAATGRLRVQVLPLPFVFLNPIPPIDFCLTAPPHGVVLSAVPPGGVFSGPGVVSNRFSPADAGLGRHTIRYTWDFSGIRCPVTVSQTVEVRVVPAVSLRPDTVLCAGQQPFQLRASPAGGTWTGPGVTATGLFTPPATPGTVLLHYDLASGCVTAPYRVTVPALPAATARWTEPACGANGVAPHRLRFEATGPDAAQMTWDFGDGSAPRLGAVVEHVYATAGRYQPRAAVGGTPAPAGPCADQFGLPAVEVRAARVPNIITPNGDGRNDTFAPELGGCPGRLQVFSRWGQPVFNTPSYRNDWGGAGLPAGLYYFLLGREDGSSRVKGWVEIVR